MTTASLWTHCSTDRLLPGELDSVVASCVCVWKGDGGGGGGCFSCTRPSLFHSQKPFSVQLNYKRQHRPFFFFFSFFLLFVVFMYFVVVFQGFCFCRFYIFILLLLLLLFKPAPVHLLSMCYLLQVREW